MCVLRRSGKEYGARRRRAARSFEIRDVHDIIFFENKKKESDIKLNCVETKKHTRAPERLALAQAQRIELRCIALAKRAETIRSAAAAQ